MAIEKHSIGGTMVELDTSETYADLPQNRVLLTEKLTVNPSVKPQIKEGLTSIDQVFEEFKPVVNMEFTTEAGGVRREVLQFKSVSDFGLTGITQQSNFLSELTLQKTQYQKIMRQLKTNKLLKMALTDKSSKENIIVSLKALIEELDNAE